MSTERCSYLQFRPIKVDICPRTCIAYTSQFESLTYCPHVGMDKTVCGMQRYQSIRKIIEGLFANEEAAWLLRYRDRYLQQTLKLFADVSVSDFSRTPELRYRNTVYSGPYTLFAIPGPKAFCRPCVSQCNCSRYARVCKVQFPRRSRRISW